MRISGVMTIILCCVAAMCCCSSDAVAQSAYFIDGYHGGIYGHYPMGQTSFMVDMLEKHPHWSINIEVEPESWDVVKQRDPEAYEAFQNMFRDQSAATGRIEYVNPTYGQSYFYNTSGESVIRQFSYGIDLVRRHFPEAEFTTYSAEEPCFTSCLPGVLKSFGYSYASTKNPNTMWGGYTRAYGGELVNWIGPDGTQILTVPRYACEDLLPGSTWQSIAWVNSRNYIEKCLQAGIENPVGMCIQDAAWSQGWGKGPWLGSDNPNLYKTWRNYVEHVSVGSTDDDWRFSQEDVLVSLMWGSQVLQRLAQEVRVAENNVVMAEKLAAMSAVYGQNPWPGETLDEAWTRLLLAQHHDCWIVPYNRLSTRRTWAEEVTVWTGVTNANCAKVVGQAVATLSPKGETGVTVYNTLGFARNERVELEIPADWKGRSLSLLDPAGKAVSAQIIERGETLRLAFIANVPPMGSAFYRIAPQAAAPDESPIAQQRQDGTWLLESDMYALVIDPAKGGTIKSVVAKHLQNRELVDAGNERSFNELRGHFFNDGGFLSNTQSPARVEVLEQNPLSVEVAVHGKIGEHPVTQTIRLTQGETRIDMTLKIDWAANPGIGESNRNFRSEDRPKPFYDERYKLLVHFPADMKSQQIYKNAPFDVCESGLSDTFFGRWDQIKHNIILNWVDLHDKADDWGLTMFSDHTTSYAHGQDHPLALTVQYSGKGLWGRDYTTRGPTEIRYALQPHAGKWDENRTWSEGERVNEPLLAVLSSEPVEKTRSMLTVQDDAFELSAVYCRDNDLYVRLFNAQSDDSAKTLRFHFAAGTAELTELNGEVRKTLDASNTDGTTSVSLSIPRFGFRTIRFTNALSR